MTRQRISTFGIDVTQRALLTKVIAMTMVVQPGVIEPNGFEIAAVPFPERV